MYMAVTHDVSVSVETRYLPDQSRPAHHRWFWAYTVRITNNRDQQIQLTERHWTITNALGECEQVSGPGVVGEEPVIESGATYVYTSGCPLNTNSGAMHGHYVMVQPDGHHFEVTIPAFSLDLPNAGRTLN